MSEEERVVVEAGETLGSVLKVVRSTLPVDLVTVGKKARKKKEKEKRIMIEMGASGAVFKVVKSTLPVDLVVTEEGKVKEKKEAHVPARA